MRVRPPGTWECAEVKIRHIFNGSEELAFTDANHTDEMLRAVEAAAHAHYRPVQVRPWVFTALGRPGEEMCADLRRLARLRLQRPDVSAAVSVASVLQLLLRRWRAELSCALVMGDANVHMAALGEGEQLGRARELAPADINVYDLQRTAVL